MDDVPMNSAKKVQKNRTNRKRKHEATVAELIEYKIDAPRRKSRPFDEKAQAEEEHLSKILFGGSASFLKCLEEAEKEIASTAIDSGVGEDDGSENEDSIRKPAWRDEDDEGIDVGQALKAQKRKLPSGGVNSRENKYSDLLKHKFESTVGTPKWAQLGKRRISSSDSDEDILQSCGFIRKDKKLSLQSGTLEFKKVTDLNRQTYGEGPFINSIEFHPSSSAALVAGSSGVLTLFAVDGKKNNKLQSIAFEKFPIICAKFINNGNEIVLGSRHSHIFSYDLMSAKHSRINLPQGMTQFKKFVVSPDSQYIAAAGKWGEVHLLSATSKERIATLKQDSEVTALTFSPSGTTLFGHSDTGLITVWDTNTRRIKHKFTDEGCLQGTTIALSNSNQFLAAGSAQGIVNLYSTEEVMKSDAPKPRKTILNLTTCINNLIFNSTSEMLAFSSGEIQNSVKLYHVGSGSVFSNFPNFQTKMGHVSALNFSPGGGYIAFGNRKSVVSLYRLKHFKNY